MSKKMQRKFIVSNDICYICACYVKSFCKNNEFLLKKNFQIIEWSRTFSLFLGELFIEELEDFLKWDS